MKSIKAVIDMKVGSESKTSDLERVVRESLLSPKALTGLRDAAKACGVEIEVQRISVTVTE